MLLTRPPLYSGTEAPFRARLACVRHAASVDSEPGSNSLVRFAPDSEKPGTSLTSKVCLAFEVCLLEYRITRLAFFSLYLVFKEQAPWGNLAAYYNG